MATVVHDNFRNAQMGKPANSTTTVDFDADDIDCSLLDQTDSGAISASTENYGQVDTATVVADRSDSSQVPLTSKTVGTVSTGTFDAADVTFNSITGDAADYLVLYKYNATPANATLIVTWDSATINEGRATVAVGVTDDLTDRRSAVDLVKQAVAAVDGQGGGGRPDMAQGGGPAGDNAADAVQVVRQALEQVATAA